MPSTELIEAMFAFNEELVNAGILISGEGLRPSSQGKRVAFDVPAGLSAMARSPQLVSW